MNYNLSHVPVTVISWQVDIELTTHTEGFLLINTTMERYGKKILNLSYLTHFSDMKTAVEEHYINKI